MSKSAGAGRLLRLLVPMSKSKKSVVANELRSFWKDISSLTSSMVLRFARNCDTLGPLRAMFVSIYLVCAVDNNGRKGGVEL